MLQQIISFTTLSYFTFLIIIAGIYYIFPTKYQWIWLLVVSLFFYVTGAGKGMALIFSVSIMSTWLCAVILDRFDSSEGKRNNTKKRICFIIGILINLILLVAFKYLNLGIYTVNIWREMCGENALDIFSIIAPIGMSFYVLQLLGYLIDVYVGRCAPEKNLGRYALFSCFFPQMITGPISRYSELSYQLFGGRKFNYRTFTFGIQRIIWGIFKKLVISERAAVIVDSVFDQYSVYSGFYIVIATVCFAFQLYTDFSGAMDIVLGSAELLGIYLPENFKNPFSSRSISEFWRRWHITLGLWFKDYVFYPLLMTNFMINIGDYSKKKIGKRHGKKIPVYIGLFVIWFMVGLWHGGAYKYILGCGLSYWLIIVGGELLQPVFKRFIQRAKIDVDSVGFHWFQTMRTIILMCITYVFFRATSFRVAIDIIKSVYPLDWRIFTDGSLLKLGLNRLNLVVFFISLCILLGVSLLQKKEDVRVRIARLKLPLRWMIYYTMIFIVIIFSVNGTNVSTFIYQNF